MTYFDQPEPPRECPICVEDAAQKARWRQRENERLLRCKSLAQWLVALDEPDAAERRTVTLTQIIEQAKAALQVDE